MKFVTQDDVLKVFGLEVDRLRMELADLAEPEWDLPTGCPPWRVRDLLAHVRVAIAWLPGMLAVPEAERAEVSAVAYYRPDARFDLETNARRIALAQSHANSMIDGASLLAEFTATGQEAIRRCREQAEGRVVRTRHGDAMLLSDFLLTRVVEVAVHGIDLALALGRDPWLTPEAADLVTELLLGPATEPALEQMNWSKLQFICRATGRTPISVQEGERVNRLGVHWLTLG